MLKPVPGKGPVPHALLYSLFMFQINVNGNVSLDIAFFFTYPSSLFTLYIEIVFKKNKTLQY